VEVEVTIVDRYTEGLRRIRMIKVSDQLKPRRCGYAPITDDADETQIEAAIAQALDNLKAKRKSST
jgi:hypothetical protein